MVIRHAILLGILVIIAVVSSACGSSAAAPTPPPAPTQGVAATQTLMSVPPQPTSATLAPRTAVPFVSPTPALRVQLPAGSSPAVVAAPTNPPPAAAPAAVAPTQPATASTGSIPTAPGVATGKRSEVKFVFLTPLKPAEEAEPPELVQMRAELKKIPGFMEVSGDEEGVGATVGYDAGLITVEQLMAKFADLKHPVKRQ